MRLELTRTYFGAGTNAVLSCNGKTICATIELPWKNNEHNHSCIPVGEYGLVKRWSPKFGNHLWLQNVPDRSLILIHPANNAMKELKGCIAPVLFITGEGKGNSSKPALARLLSFINSNAAKKETITLVITPAP